jgi:hypothetical protein
MWADRDDIPDGVTYVNRLREPLFWPPLMAYLIDSDIMVDFTRGNAKAADYLDGLGDDCLLSAITALEIDWWRSQPARSE